jgi:hypothetical protein
MRAFVATVALVGCTVEEPGLGVDVGAKQSANSLSENSLARFAPQLAQIVDGPLAQSPALASVGVDVAGRRLLHYLAHCALRQGDTVSFRDAALAPHRIPDGPIVIAGVPTVAGIGLAREWPARALTVDERRWVVGCTLAHINGNSVPVDISVRGNHPALATTSPERGGFPFLEGAFYGDIVVPTGQDLAAPPQPVVLHYACWGPALAACPDPEGELTGRICTRGRCDHFVVTGPCERPPAAPPTLATACDARTRDNYDTCYTAAITGQPGPSVDRYTAGVVTTYLGDPRCD